jgi:hypothetical protein
MITEDQILELLGAQPIHYEPSYRVPICTGCRKPGYKFWHIWLDKGGFKKEIHLCKKCGLDYGMKP